MTLSKYKLIVATEWLSLCLTLRHLLLLYAPDGDDASMFFSKGMGCFHVLFLTGLTFLTFKSAARHCDSSMMD